MNDSNNDNDNDNDNNEDKNVIVGLHDIDVLSWFSRQVDGLPLSPAPTN